MKDTGYIKAGLFPRFVAALIDALVGWVFVFIPIIGAIISVLYILLKDALPYQLLKEEEWKNRSVGKRVMKLEIRHLDGDLIDMPISARRNIPLTIGSFIAVIPLLGWIIGPIVGLIFAIIELIFLLTDDENRRLGDRWARTVVIMEQEEAAEKQRLRSKEQSGESSEQEKEEKEEKSLGEKVRRFPGGDEEDRRDPAT